jgi:hypothetical protein
VNALDGRWVRVYRTWGGTWDGRVVEHDCAGIMISNPHVGYIGTLFVPWVQVKWLDVLAESAA